MKHLNLRKIITLCFLSILMMISVESISQNVIFTFDDGSEETGSGSDNVCMNSSVTVEVNYDGVEILNILSPQTSSNFTWNIDPDGDGTFTFSPDDQNNISGDHNFIFFEDYNNDGYDEGFDNVIADLTITVIDPIVEAGEYGPFCYDGGVQILTGDPSPDGGGIEMGVWSGSGVNDINGTTDNSTADFDPSSFGGQTITVTYTFTDADGCIGADDADIKVIDPDCLISSGVNEACQDDIVNYEGPIGMVSYTWTVDGAEILNGIDDQDNVDIEFGSPNDVSISLSIVDENGCSSTCMKTVSVNPSPAFSVEDKICSMDNTSYSISFSTDGNVTSSVGNVDNINNIITDIPNNENAQLIITSNNGCELDVEVISPDCSCDPIPDPSLETTSLQVCHGFPNPDFEVINNMSGEYITQWFEEGGIDAIATGNIFKPMVSDVGVYMYEVEFKDPNFECFSDRVSLLFTIKEKPVVEMINNVTGCGGESISEIEISATSGSEITWSNDNTDIGLAEEGDDNIDEFVANENMSTQNATITVLANLDGCESDTEDFTITINPTPTISADNNASCVEMPQVLQVNLNNASSYTWSGPSSISFNNMGQGDNNNPVTATGSSEGTYELAVTTVSALGCSAVESIEFEVYEGISVTGGVVSDVTCNGDEDGEIEISASGGLGTYSYNWDNNENGSNIDDLEGGNYSVSISSGNCPTYTNEYVIVEPGELTYDVTKFNESCHDRNDGEIHITASGGTPPYEYQIDGQTNQIGDFLNLPDGVYSISVTDKNDCSSDGVSQTEVIKGTEIIEDILFADGISSSCEDTDQIVLSDNSSTIPLVPYLGRKWEVNNNDAGTTDNLYFGNEAVSYSLPGQYNVTAELMAERRQGSNPMAENCSVPSSVYTVNVYDTPELILGQPIDLDANIDGWCDGDIISISYSAIDNNNNNISTDFNILNGPISHTTNDDIFVDAQGLGGQDLDIEVSVESSDGCISPTETTTTPIYNNPEAIISGTATDVNTDFVVDQTFTISGENSNHNEISLINFYWDFPMNLITTQINPSNFQISPPETGEYEINLQIENDKNCFDSTTEVLYASNCAGKFVSTTQFPVTICEGDNVNFNVSHDPTIIGSNQLGLKFYTIYIRDLSGNQSDQVLDEDTDPNNEENWSTNLQFPSNLVGNWQILYSLTESNELDGCNGDTKVLGTLNIIDKINTSNISLKVDTSVFCLDSIDNGQFKALIEGFSDVDNEDIVLKYRFVDSLIGEPKTISIPKNSQSVEINLEYNQLNRDTRLEILGFCASLDTIGCNKSLTNSFTYIVRNCGVTQISDNVTSIGAPSINNSTEAFICDNITFSVRDSVGFIPGVNEDDFTIKNVIVKNQLSQGVESFNFLTDHYILKEEDSFNDINLNFSLDYFQEYYVYTVVEQFGDNIVTNANTKITFFPSPDHSNVIPPGPFCSGLILELLYDDLSKEIAKTNRLNSFIEWKTGVSGSNDISSVDNKTFIHLDFPKNTTVNLESILSYEYDNANCLSTQTQDLNINDESALTPKKIYWWPGDILSSEEDSSMCFQWGLVGGPDNLSNKPYLFTSNNASEDSKFVDDNNNKLPIFDDIYYVKTWERENGTCEDNPDCYTTVFFDEDQFNSRSEENRSFDFRLAPNPSSGVFDVIPVNVDIGDELLINVYDFASRLVFSREYEYFGESIPITLNNPITGVYFLQIIDYKGNIVSKKLAIH